MLYFNFNHVSKFFVDYFQCVVVSCILLSVCASVICAIVVWVNVWVILTYIVDFCPLGADLIDRYTSSGQKSTRVSQDKSQPEKIRLVDFCLVDGVHGRFIIFTSVDVRQRHCTQTPYRLFIQTTNK